MAYPSNTMLTYARTEMASFEEKPFHEIDGLIFSWLSYLQLPPALSEKMEQKPLPLRELFMSEYFQDMVREVHFPEDTIQLLGACAASPRYRGVKLSRYVERREADRTMQFAAMTFSVLPKCHYIAFRGTDRSFIGWKEDLNLSLSDPIPSQDQAVRYLKVTAIQLKGKLVLGGHSKGGNLASYAAASCGSVALQKRISAVFSFDGPGFLETELKRPGFVRIRPKLKKFLPQSSVVGMILNQEGEYEIIHSSEHGIMQHNPFSWEVQGTELLRKDHLHPQALIVYNGINRWMGEMPEENRKNFIDTVFRILEETGVDGFHELGKDLQKNISVICKAAIGLDKESQKLLFSSLRMLAESGLRSIPDILRTEAEDVIGMLEQMGEDTV